MELIGVALVLGFLSGALLGWVSFLKVGKLEKEVAAVNRRLQLALNLFESQSSTGNNPKQSDSIGNPATLAKSVPESLQSLGSQTENGSQTHSEQEAAASENVWTGEAVGETDDADLHPQHPPPVPNPPTILDRLRDQWMVWLGGLSVGLSGIFMVRYSIEQGLLGPVARVGLSLFFGVALHWLAEWGRRRSLQQYNALAALAGGASIILYSALLAAFFLYDLFPASIVFAALTAISLGTMALALLHGPVLAILGILGAYVIPALVDTGSNNVLGLYVYVLIITGAALLLMRSVYRPWLWGGMLAGTLGWWLLTLDTYEALGLRGYYLAALLYMVLALPDWDWRLRKPVQSAAKEQSLGKQLRGVITLANLRKSHLPKTLSEAPGFFSLFLLVAAFGMTIVSEQRLASAIYQWTPFVAILLVAAGSKPKLLKLVVISMGVQFLAWLTLGLSTYNGLSLEGIIGPGQFDFMVYAAWMAFLYTALSFRSLMTSSSRNFCCAIAVASPLVWLSLAYLLVTDLSESVNWGVVTIGLGVFYLGLAAWRLRLDNAQPFQDNAAEKEYFAVWLIMAGHFAYSLAVAIMVREAGLTLALSAQILSIAWLIHIYNPPKLDLFLKLMLAVVVARLTLNPWLLTYPADVHWSFWTYGGATLFAASATWRLRNHLQLAKWLELASLHLLVLTLWAEIRYYLYDGNIFGQQMDLLELSLNTALWSSLGLVYFLRHRASENLKALYLLMSKTLLVLSLLSYLGVLVFRNPYFSGELISATPIFNILLLSFGAPVGIGVLLYFFYDQAYKNRIAVFTAISGFVFINVEIRHLWTSELSSLSTMSNGELYTYTIVWLVLAVISLLAGSIRFGSSVYRAGFGLLMVVIAKIFLFDMADLEGLLRVASFMGLGLSLLGLAYLYQRFNLSSKSSGPSQG